MKKYIVIKALQKTKMYMFLILIFSIIISYLNIQIPLYLKYAIDGISFNNTNEIPKFIKVFFRSDIFYNIMIVALFLIATIILISFATYVRNRISFKLNLKINKNLKMEIFKHIENLEYQSYYNYDKDEMIQRIKDDANVFSNFFNTSLNLVLDTTFFLIFMIRESVKLNLFITIYVLISIIILIIFAIWYFNKIDIKISNMVIKRKKLLSKSISSFYNSKLIKMLNKQKEEIAEYKELNKSYTKSSIEFINLVLFHEIITDHIQYLATPIIYMIGGIMVITNQLTLGSLTVLISFAKKVIGFFIALGNNIDEIDDFIVITRLLNNLMKLEQENKALGDFKLDGDILFINVTVRQDDKIILKNVNLHIKKGEKVAIVGENGAGKSILVKTLLGFYDYTGNIYINNINLNRVNKKNIRNYISLLEDAFIFSETINNNICLYKNVDKDKLNMVAKKVNIYDEIMNFKDKYETYVGERGVMLSGGQKQRIALARVLLQNKSILILDEAINKIDEITKTKIIEEAIIKDSNTILMITHDLNIIKRMDKIIFLHDGTSYIGTHKQLLTHKAYNNMVIINEDLV